MSLFVLRLTKMYIGDFFNKGKELIAFVVMDEEV